jgi:hypothetical protein
LGPRIAGGRPALDRVVGGRRSPEVRAAALEVRRPRVEGGACGAGKKVRASAGGRERRGRNRTNRSFSTNQWHWWVISPNSRKLGFGGVPLEALHENHGVGGLLHLFSGADPRWSWWSWVCLAEKIWSGAVFLDLEQRGALPNTPLLLVVTTELLSWLVDLINCSKTSQKNNNRRLVV